MNVDDLARGWARYPILWSPRVSGDGKWLAWTWTGTTETGEVWIAPTDGARIGQIMLPETCANVCFGGRKRNRLFMTASQSLYSVYVETQGAHFC